MKSLLVFLAVGALSVLASSRAARQADRSFLVSVLATSGLVFVLVGAFLGPSAAAVYTAADLEAMQPLLSFGLGAAGLFIGLNLEPGVLRGLPAPVFRAAGAQALAAMGAVSIPLAAVLYASTPLGVLQSLGAGVALGASAGVSSGHYAVLWYRSGRMERAQSVAVALLATLDDLGGLLLLAVAMAIGSGATPLHGLGLVALTAALGLLNGALLAYLCRRVEDPSELVAIVLGGAALVSGAAAFLSLSALLAGIACGATLSQIGGKSVDRLWKALSRMDRPLYLLLLFLIGVQVRLDDWPAWMLVPIFVALRFLAKVYGGRWGRKVASGSVPLPRDVGYALLAQGGVSLCILAETFTLVGRARAQVVFDAGVLGALLNEVLAATAFPRAFLTPPRDAQRELKEAGLA
ncbi:MAG TPA: sodium:proton exchanger [Myxococcales bacterium]|nr:sodium:proton exchanger [Myxococcales bacterium]